MNFPGTKKNFSMATIFHRTVLVWKKRWKIMKMSTSVECKQFRGVNELSQTSMMELFCENSWLNFHKKVGSCIFDWVLISITRLGRNQLTVNSPMFFVCSFICFVFRILMKSSVLLLCDYLFFIAPLQVMWSNILSRMLQSLDQDPSQQVSNLMRFV